MPALSICDGLRLDAPPGGFVCTGLTLPAGAAFATVQTTADRAGWPVPLLQDNDEWVLLAPLLVNTSGAYSGLVTYRLLGADGDELASVTGTLESSSVEVTDPAAVLRPWASAQATAWGAAGDVQSREVGIRLGLLTELYATAASRSVAATLVNGAPRSLEWSDAVSVAQAVAQARSELSGAGLGSEWSSLPAELTRASFPLLPGLAAETGSDGARFADPVSAIAVGVVVGLLWDTALVQGFVTWVQDEAWEDASASIRGILGDESAAGADGLCDDPLGSPPPSEGFQCIEWNPDEPLAAELSELLPSLEDADPDAPFSPSPEGTVAGECGDGTDNDGDGAVDGDDVDCEGSGAPVATGERITGPHGGTLVRISAGTFDMGCTAGQSDCYDDESPVMPVTLTHDFYMGETEVTQGEYQAVMGSNPSYFPSCGSTCPVEDVSWHEAAAFTNAVSTSAGLTECYACSGSGTSASCSVAVAPYTCDGYRLPTEAEWEGAARCGEDLLYAGSNTVGDVGWYTENSDHMTHAVAGKDPNACGLYDMSGNVWEWTQDGYDSGYYTSAGRTDPTGVSSDRNWVSRGGSWDFGASYARVARRISLDPGDRDGYRGLRLTRTLP